METKVGTVNLKVIMALGGWSLAGGTTVRRKFALIMGMVLFKTTEVVFNTNWRSALLWAGGHDTGPSYLVQGEAFEFFVQRQASERRTVITYVRSFIEYFGEIWAQAVDKCKKGAHFKSIMKKLMLLIEGVDHSGGDEDYLGFMKYMQTHYDKLMTATEALAKRSWKKERTQLLKIRCQAKYDHACQRFKNSRNQYLEKMPRYEMVHAMVDTELMNYGTILYNFGASRWNAKVAPLVSTWISELAMKWEYVTAEGPVFTTSQILHIVMGLKHRTKSIEHAVKVEEVVVTTEEDQLLAEDEEFVAPKCGCFTNIFRRFTSVHPAP